MDLHVLSSFLSWPTDWFILGGLFIVSMVDTIRSGSQRSSAVVLAFLATAILYSQLPQAFIVGAVIGGLTFPIAQVVVFGILFALMLVAALRIIQSFSADEGKPLLAVFMALATVSLLVLIWLQVPVLQSVWTFGPSIKAIFAEGYRFFWVLGTLGVYAYVRS